MYSWGQGNMGQLGHGANPPTGASDSDAPRRSVHAFREADDAVWSPRAWRGAAVAVPRSLLSALSGASVEASQVGAQRPREHPPSRALRAW